MSVTSLHPPIRHLHIQTRREDTRSQMWTQLDKNTDWKNSLRRIHTLREAYPMSSSLYTQTSRADTYTSLPPSMQQWTVLCFLLADCCTHCPAITDNSSSESLFCFGMLLIDPLFNHARQAGFICCRAACSCVYSTCTTCSCFVYFPVWMVVYVCVRGF